MDWKIIAALFVAVAIVVSGFFASGGAGSVPSIAPQAGSDILGDIVSGAKNAISNLLSITTEKNTSRTLQVSGSLEMRDSVLKLDSPADSVAVQFGAPASIAVGGETVSLPEGAVSLENFTGRIDAYGNKSVYVGGNAEKVDASGVGISSAGGKTVPVKIAAPADSVKIYSITIGKLLLNASGSINVGREKAALKIENEILEIDGFLGNLEISGASLSLKGLSTKVLLNGREKVSVG